MVKINFVGDIALFKEFQRRNVDPMQDICLPKSDFNIGNFEFIIPNKRENFFFDVSEEYKVDYDFFSKMKIERFNALGFANNHAMDYGREGIDDVISILESKNIKHFGIGEQAYNVLEFTVDTISFAVIGCVKNGRWIQEGAFSPNLYNKDLVINEIEAAKNKVDHVIVFPHIGSELVDVPSPQDIDTCRSFIDAGATAVIGHHPHIIQGFENYKNRIIAYSLGSFIYLPEYEVGYSKKQGKEREFSICLNLSFSKDELVAQNFYYYKLDHQKLIPIPYKEENGYFSNLNKWVGHPDLYYKKIKKQLIKREIVSFFQRLKKDPFKTIKHYCSYLEFKHIKIIFKNK